MEKLGENRGEVHSELSQPFSSWQESKKTVGGITHYGGFVGTPCVV